MRAGPMAVVVLTAAFVVAACEAREPTVVEAVADSIAAELLAPPPPVSGVAIAVGRDDRVVLDRAYGMADQRTDRPLTSADPLRIGSLTKQFTAAAILKLVEDGRIDLDVHIEEYLPGFSTQGHAVTVRHLLSHTSGIPNYTALYAGTGRQPVPRPEVLDTLQVHPFDFSPGEAYRYSNSGYYLLGVIIEEVTGDTYADHLQESLFDPLGLANTSYCGTSGAAEATGFRVRADTLEVVVLEDTDYLGGSGGLCSTAADLVRWQRALATGRVLRPSSYALMTTPTVIANGETVPHGFGVDLDDLEGHAVVEHGGATGGFNARMAYYPDDGLAVAVLINTNTPKADAVQQAVARSGLGLARLVPTDIPLTAEERARYVGIYDAGPIELHVVEEGKRLLLKPSRAVDGPTPVSG